MITHRCGEPRDEENPANGTPYDQLPDDQHGPAVVTCWTVGGQMFVVSGSNEYVSQVDFCPFCGEAADVKATRTEGRVRA